MLGIRICFCCKLPVIVRAQPHEIFSLNDHFYHHGECTARFINACIRMGAAMPGYELRPPRSFPSPWKRMTQFPIRKVPQ